MDLLAPGPDPDAPRILWHVNREYSRDSFAPTLKATGNTFELRLNRSSMDVASYERRVIYRYAVGEDGHVHRVEPIAVNARGFVEEWLDAPWSESRDFADERGVAELGKLHQDFNPPAKLNDTGFVEHTYGPCAAVQAEAHFRWRSMRCRKRQFRESQAASSVRCPADISAFVRTGTGMSWFPSPHSRIEPARART
jgi:hypothetical protein